MTATLSPLIPDENERVAALNPQRSYIVQAPAGSGKTEILAQRVMVLLSHVEQPEEILAMTFTKKAAAEMRARILGALQKAEREPEPKTAHERKTWMIARKVLERDQTLQWHLKQNPNRLRIQTLDSFNVSLTRCLPILSHFGAPPELIQNPEPLYREAVQEFLSHLEENVAWSDAIEKLLKHRDNDLEKVQSLLITMLQKRDQWMPYIMGEHEPDLLRAELESHLTAVVQDILDQVCAEFPLEYQDELLEITRFAATHARIENADTILTACLDIIDLPGSDMSDIPQWIALSELLLTKDHTWRLRFDKNLGFPAPSTSKNVEEKNHYQSMKNRATALVDALRSQPAFHAALIDLIKAPARAYEAPQWETLKALYFVLNIVVAQLKVIFRRYGQIDYIENAQAALFALGNDEAPTDLALALDYQIRHLLIDEFQDTSTSQYRLIEKIIAGWENEDGRTLFIVGDPMQSIYRFREAEVGLFIRARKHGIGNIHLNALTLCVNFRSTPEIVEWVNTHFARVLPSYEDIGSGAVPYSRSQANAANASADTHVECHLHDESVEQTQAEAIVTLIQAAKLARPQETIAILVRARNHLREIIPALKKADLNFRAIDIDRLDSRPVIQDLLALTRALLHPNDRIAWLAVLRAPWCGLSLADLHKLASLKTEATHCLLSLMQTNLQLSPEGLTRLQQVSTILLTQFTLRRSYPLRLWIESTWLNLGGPASLDFTSDIDDARAYFDLLEKLDRGGEIDLETLTTHIRQLFATPDPAADNSLQIMTIFNAKGLEFDTVILPQLEKQSPPERKQLLLWLEKPRAVGGNALVLAPLHATGDETDSIYQHIKEQHAIKADHEMGRLLYVAATRAKKQLHLFMARPKAAEVKNARSLLDKLWPTLHLQPTGTKPLADTSEASLPRQPRLLRRLHPQWKNPVTALHPIAIPKEHQAAPGFHLYQHSAAFVGTVIHRILQQLALLGTTWWTEQTNTRQKVYVEHHLSQLGILSAELTPARERVLLAIQNTLEDKRGLWILQAHEEAQSEWALNTVSEKAVKQLIIDRTFVENQTRWIIDYKTSQPQQENLETFLAEEQNQHAEQMQNYYRAIRHIESKPIRLGLYFPLLSAWREWTLDE